MMKIVWVRHAETDFNRQGIVQGSKIDSPLNELGHQQAHALFKHYGALPFTAVYTSALQRTQQTLKGWKEAGHILTPCPELNEISWGDIEGHVSTLESRQHFYTVVKAWTEGNFQARLPNAESAQDVWDRVTPFINHLQTLNDNDSVLVCSHGRMLRIILGQLIGKGLHEMEAFPNDNTGVSLTSYSPATGWVAHTLNCTKHLMNDGLEPFYAQYYPT